jgi:hypothetical protein
MTALPYGAREIVETRSVGKRPADMVLLSLIGPLRERNPVVVASPDRAYDWRFLVGLEVLIVARTEICREHVSRIVRDVLAHSPTYLGVWFADRQGGANVAFGSWRLKSGRTMTATDRAAFSGIGK